MLKLLLYIFFLSAAGIAVIFVFFNFLLQKIFHMPHVSNHKSPEEMELKSVETFIQTRNGKKVQLWDLNSDSQMPVILGIHGWANTSSKLLNLGSELSKDWRVFLLNARNHGDSDDDKYSSIIKYSEDLTSAINYIRDDLEINRDIYLIGHSFGGAAVLFTAARDKRVKAVISIATFADIEKMMRTNFMKQKIPDSLISSMIKYIEFRIGLKLRHLSPLYTITKFEGPTLIVHGTKDEIVNFAELNHIKKATNRENVKKLILKGHSHNTSLDDPILAVEVTKFLKRMTLN